MFFGGGIPFSHAFPGGVPPGMGGHFRGGGDDEPAKDVDTTKLYEVLGVAKDASQSDIKKAYMKVCGATDRAAAWLRAHRFVP